MSQGVLGIVGSDVSVCPTIKGNVAIISFSLSYFDNPLDLAAFLASLYPVTTLCFVLSAVFCAISEGFASPLTSILFVIFIGGDGEAETPGTPTKLNADVLETSGRSFGNPSSPISTFGSAFFLLFSNAAIASSAFDVRPVNENDSDNAFPRIFPI